MPLLLAFFAICLLCWPAIAQNGEADVDVPPVSICDVPRLISPDYEGSDAELFEVIISQLEHELYVTENTEVTPEMYTPLIQLLMPFSHEFDTLEEAFELHAEGIREHIEQLEDCLELETQASQ